MKIHRARLQRIIKEELERALQEAMVPQLYKGGAGLGSAGKIKTSEVDFEWGDYDGRHRNETYWVSNETGGELGSVQFPGDPYTYNPQGEQFIVVSAPEPTKGKIGVVIDRPQTGQAAASVDGPEASEGEPEEITEKPCSFLTKQEILERLMPMTLEEIMYKYSRNRNYGLDVFGVGALLGPTTAESGLEAFSFTSITLKELAESKDMIVNEVGEDKWNDILHHPTRGLGLGIITKMIKNGTKPCPPA